MQVTHPQTLQYKLVLADRPLTILTIQANEKRVLQESSYFFWTQSRDHFLASVMARPTTESYEFQISLKEAREAVNELVRYIHVRL